MNNNIISQFMCDNNDTQYDSWNQLVPVMIKISNLEIDGVDVILKFGTYGLLIKHDEFELYDNNTDVYSVRCNIIKFIVWYNQYLVNGVSTQKEITPNISIKIDDHT